MFLGIVMVYRRKSSLVFAPELFVTSPRLHYDSKFFMFSSVDRMLA